MSRRNGDKSRFHRERKQRIALRKRTRELLSRATGHPKPERARSAAQPGKPG